MTAPVRRGTTIEDILGELEISDPTETSVGTWDGPDGEMRVVIIHETGHVYAIPWKSMELEGMEQQGAALLFRLPVEKIGVEAAIWAMEKRLEPERSPPMRECDMMGCRNAVPANRGRSIAPGTCLAVCNECAPIVSVVG